MNSYREDRRKQGAGDEATPPTIVIRAGGRASDRMKAMFIRHSVFIEELGLPAGWEKDGRDDDAVLLIATDITTGSPTGTARVVDDGGAVANIGMLAVSSSLRGHGIGTALLLAALKTARDLNFTSVVMSAPALSVPFCQKQGFEKQGEEYAIGGVSHQNMILALA